LPTKLHAGKVVILEASTVEQATALKQLSAAAVAAAAASAPASTAAASNTAMPGSTAAAPISPLGLLYSVFVLQTTVLRSAQPEGEGDAVVAAAHAQAAAARASGVFQVIVGLLLKQC
jgi:hypothetical protein